MKIEDIVLGIIRKAPDESRLLGWAVTSYRALYPGIVLGLEDAIVNDADLAIWKSVAEQVLHELKVSTSWTELGVKWINENKGPLLGLADGLTNRSTGAGNV